MLPGWPEHSVKGRRTPKKYFSCLEAASFLAGHLWPLTFCENLVHFGTFWEMCQEFDIAHQLKLHRAGIRLLFKNPQGVLAHSRQIPPEGRQFLVWVPSTGRLSQFTFQVPGGSQHHPPQNPPQMPSLHSTLGGSSKKRSPAGIVLSVLQTPNQFVSGYWCPFRGRSNNSAMNFSSSGGGSSSSSGSPVVKNGRISTLFRAKWGFDSTFFYEFCSFSFSIGIRLELRLLLGIGSGLGQNQEVP